MAPLGSEWKPMIRGLEDSSGRAGCCSLVCVVDALLVVTTAFVNGI